MYEISALDLNAWKENLTYMTVRSRSYPITSTWWILLWVYQ